VASITFKKGEDYALKLSRLAAGSDEIAKKAIYEGAGIIADEVRKGLESVPVDKFRFLKDGEQMHVLSKEQKDDLLGALGVTPIRIEASGDINAKIGFDGYGSKPTKAYPKGVPNQLLARAVESGSSVRTKHPFVRPAVNAMKIKAKAEMEKIIDREIEKIMK